MSFMRLRWPLWMSSVGLVLACSSSSDDPKQVPQPPSTETDGGDTICEVGQERSCRCADGRSGTERCNPTGYGECECPNEPHPLDAGSDAEQADGGVCLGDDSPALDCDFEVEDQDCNAQTDGEMCYLYSEVLRGGVAAEAIACLKSRSDACDALDCGATAIARACDDPTATTFCDQLATSLGCTPEAADSDGFSREACVALARGLSPSGRTSLNSCLTDESTECDATANARCLNAALYH